MLKVNAGPARPETEVKAARTAPAAPEVESVGTWIDGRMVLGTAKPVLLREPATRRPLAWIVHPTQDELDRVIASATRTLALWRGTPFAERARRLRRLGEIIRSRGAEIAELISREQGKPRIEAWTHEILPALDHLKYVIRNAERYHAGVMLEDLHPLYAHKEAHYLYDPLGVVALITAAPLPFAISLIQVVSALAMGNAVVLKPSERTPMTGLLVGQLCVEAGMPAGLVNVAPCLPEETIGLVTHPKIEKVFMTGSVEAGQHVAAAAGCALRPVVLMLGGNHPAVVAADVDVRRAARGIVWGALANCGQNCGSVERVYVEEGVASAFVEAVLHEVDRLRVGNPASEDVDVGPLASDQRRQTIHAQVTDAIARGAQLMRGGRMPDAPGYFYMPTVILGPPSDCRLMREETGGPVIPIVVVESLERAIMLANDSDYALSASGWTRSRKTAERLIVALQAGVVTVNDVLYSYGDPASTWSGYRQSGVGGSHGRPGLGEMARRRFVSCDFHAAEAPLHAYPYGRRSHALVASLMTWLHRHGPRRLLALSRLARSSRFRARVPFSSFLFSRRRGMR